MGYISKMKLSVLFASAALASGISEDISTYDTQCTRIGGTCLNWDYYLCTAGWETGLCSGASSIRCCKPCDRSCQNLENSYNDKACTDKGGKCQHNSNKCSSGGYSGGLCGGPSARQCSGTVWVTHAFRREGQNIGGTVVPPASNSNHLVGHSIDFNLDAPSGWCNGDCLDWETNSYAKCFTDKIQADRTLDWGAMFNDPVHVDDYLNGRNPSEWQRLYYANQACP